MSVDKAIANLRTHCNVIITDINQGIGRNTPGFATINGLLKACDLVFAASDGNKGHAAMIQLHWGATILNNYCDRRAWLKLEEQVFVQSGRVITGNYMAGVSHWEGVNTFALPAGHWAYEPIERGFTPWSGGERAPEDWDKGEVLLRNGQLNCAAALEYWTHARHGQPALDSGYDTIGYHSTAGDYTIVHERSGSAVGEPVTRRDVDRAKTLISYDAGGFNPFVYSKILEAIEMLAPPETQGEQLYRQYSIADMIIRHAPGSEADMIMFAQWIMDHNVK